MIKRNENDEEERKVRKLQLISDFACMLLHQESMTLEEGYKLLAGVKRIALHLFPDKGDTFDLIYGARFRRILSERFLMM